MVSACIPLCARSPTLACPWWKLVSSCLRPYSLSVTATPIAKAERTDGGISGTVLAVLLVNNKSMAQAPHQQSLVICVIVPGHLSLHRAMSHDHGVASLHQPRVWAYESDPARTCILTRLSLAPVPPILSCPVLYISLKAEFVRHGCLLTTVAASTSLGGVLVRSVTVVLLTRHVDYGERPGAQPCSHAPSLLGHRSVCVPSFGSALRVSHVRGFFSRRGLTVQACRISSV